MTGRDMKNFMLARRADNRETGELVRRVTDGLHSSKYKEVDYEALKALTQKKKAEGQQSLAKVKKLQQVSKKSKENNLQNQHKAVWNKELVRLQNHQRKQEAEVAFVMSQGASHSGQSGPLRHAWEDMERLAEDLTKARNKFKKETHDPVLELCEDLKYVVRQGGCEDPGAVLEQVEAVRSQQKTVLERLQHEADALMNELLADNLPTLDDLHDPQPHFRLRTGIPEEAFDLECPDEELKTSILQEFIMIDKNYMMRLEDLELEHRDVICSERGGWSEADHETFLYLLEAYPHDLQGRRMLYIDMMRRTLTHKSRQDIVTHEAWWESLQHYHKRTKTLAMDWTRDRAELLNRAKCVFAELIQAEQERMKRKEQKSKQQALCDELYTKVCEWREKKMEALRLEHEMIQRQREQKMEELQQEEEKERQRRMKEKQKICEYQSVQKARQQEQAERDQERLRQLQEQLTQQAKVDQERVRYREEQLKLKQEERAQREEERLREQQEKEEVLEALRQKVRPEVETDILRLWSDTETWKAHTTGKDEFINIQQPLYNINTYNDKQINSDPRVRLDNELRARGLQNNPYARQAIAQLQPPTQPRKDMQSTVFK